MLNLVGLVLFILGAGGANKYTSAPHMYAADMLRVVLDTRHKEGTVYILPSREHGFDAVWSPKIDYEYRESDEGSPLSSNPHDVKPRKRGELKRLDRRLAAFSSVSELTTEEVNCLATWLYQPESAPAAMRKIDCVRAPGINLMAPSVMLSLYHAEYLIFMQRHRLEPRLLKLSGSFRQVKGSGMDIDNRGRQIGKLPGLQGYQEAVRHLYSLFNEPIDSSALLPTSAPPKKCELFLVCPDSIEGYVAALWDHCIVSEESTIAALYAFTMFSDFDIGNDAANGRHRFPLRPRDREGDLVSWHVIWRQAWYAAVIAQLTSMSPTILSAFVAGILQ
jgi:hypothetical protein